MKRRSKDSSKQSSGANTSVQTFDRHSLQEAWGVKKKASIKKHLIDSCNGLWGIDAQRAPGRERNYWKIYDNYENSSATYRSLKASDWPWLTEELALRISRYGTSAALRLHLLVFGCFPDLTPDSLRAPVARHSIRHRTSVEFNQAEINVWFLLLFFFDYLKR